VLRLDGEEHDAGRDGTLRLPLAVDEVAIWYP
jgi:hypothetical protein